MAQEGGTSVIKVKAVGQNSTGRNWTIEAVGDEGKNGRKFNLAKKNNPAMPLFDFNKTYFLHWSWFDIPGTENSMRMVNDWREAVPTDREFDSRKDGAPAPSVPGSAPVRQQSTPQTPAPVQRMAHEGPPKPEGFRTGQALNIGVLMAGQLGVNPDDPNYWPMVFSCADEALSATYTYEKGAGKFPKVQPPAEVPF